MQNKTILKKYLRTRYLTILFVALSAALYAMATNVFYDEMPLHRQLSLATQLRVANGSFQWINSFDSASLHTATNFREIAFLASRPGNKNKDLYIAKVKIAPETKLLEITPPVNLTNSEAGDDFLFKVKNHRVFVATKVLGQIRSLSVFDLRGAPSSKNNDWSKTQRILSKLSDFQKTGRFSGIGKTNIRFDRPATQLKFSIGGNKTKPSIFLEWKDGTGQVINASVNLAAFETDSKKIHITKDVHLPKRPILWLVDSIRELSWIGPGPIEWAEGRFFALKDMLNQFKYSIAGDQDMDAADVAALQSYKVDFQLPEGSEVGDYDSLTWPPKELDAPVFSKKKNGEGIWVPAHPDFMKSLPNAPPSVYATFIRSDRSRPYVRVKLHAIDTRQLDLHMIGGHEDPISTTGEVGTGKLPNDKDTLEKLALVFNGAFKTIHGQYGMMANRTVLLPPKDDAATIATDKYGRVALGSWPKTKPIPDDMTSFRQNMDPLLEDGIVNPRKRYLWGFTLGSDISQMNTIRSGLCLKDNGILVYAWGEDLTADSLGVAMKAAGCGYGIHLDMNPFHTSFVAFHLEYKGENIQPKFKYRKLIKETRFWPDRYVHGAPKDFFYMTLRTNQPPGEKWNSEGITQPLPAFLPAVFTKQKNGIEMVAIDTTAVRPTLLPGAIPSSMQHNPAAGAAVTIPKDLGLVAEVLLGPWSSNRGQMTNGMIVASLKPDEATLCINEANELQIRPWQPEGSIQNALQGTWLIRDGDKKATKQEIIAVAIEKNWIILAKGDGQTISQALLELGIKKAIALPNSDNGILLRSNGDMTTVKGKKQKMRDASLAALRFSAAKRQAFGTQLTNLF